MTVASPPRGTRETRTPAGGSQTDGRRRDKDGDAQAGSHQARGDAARRQAPQDREMAERVVESAGRAGEQDLAGAAA